MKFRLIALLVLLTFSSALAACSLAEDITPPPGYRSPLPLPTAERTFQTPEPTLKTGPTASLEVTIAAPTRVLVPAGTGSATPVVETSSTSIAPAISFSGKVTNASGSVPTGSLTAHLYLYNTGSSTVVQTLTTEVQPTGLYQFFNVPADVKTTYFVMVEFDNVTYISDPATYDGTIATYELPVTIYDSTSDLNLLSLTQIHMEFDFSTEGKVQTHMLYVVSNLGMKSVVVQSDGASIPFIQIPTGAADVQYELAQEATPLARATNGFALLPGADKQYGIIATYSLPYISSLKLTQPFSLPVVSETIIVPEGVRVNSDQLDDTGIQTIQGMNYHFYQGGNLASGSTLALALSGRPGKASGFTLNRQTGILIGVGAAGILLIGLGVILYLRERAWIKQQVVETETAIGKESPGLDRDTIMDAIIALDDQFNVGGISKEAYTKRRDELKKRLRTLV